MVYHKVQCMLEMIDVRRSVVLVPYHKLTLNLDFIESFIFHLGYIGCEIYTDGSVFNCKLWGLTTDEDQIFFSDMDFLFRLLLCIFPFHGYLFLRKVWKLSRIIKPSFNFYPVLFTVRHLQNKYKHQFKRLVCCRRLNKVKLRKTWFSRHRTLCTMSPSTMPLPSVDDSKKLQPRTPGFASR